MNEFDKRRQRNEESFVAYLVAIQQLAEDADLTVDHCDACRKKCYDRRIAARIISGISDEGTRRKLLEEKKFPSRERVIEICSTRESAQNNTAEHQSRREARLNELSEVREVKTYPRRSWNRGGHEKQEQNVVQERRHCSRCGQTPHEEGQSCPALSRTCFNCGKTGHMKSVCRAEGRQPKDQKSQEVKRFNHLSIRSLGTPSPNVSVRLSDVETGKDYGKVHAIVDTGAMTCAAGEALLDFIRFPRKKLHPPQDYRLVAYGGSQSSVLAFSRSR